MSGQEMDRISEEQHQRLCAWIFGELEGADARAFEAELAASSALQAERARLEATIGLVRRSLPAEALSAEAHASVLAAAEARPVTHAKWTLLRGGGAWRVAAGLALVAGALVFVRASGRFAGRSEDQLAQQSVESERAPGKDEAAAEPFQYRIFPDAAAGQEAKESDASKAKSTFASEAANGRAPAAPIPSAALERDSAAARMSTPDAPAAPPLEALGYAGSAEVSSGEPTNVDAGELENLRALGYGGVPYSEGGSYKGPSDTVPGQTPQEDPSTANRTVSGAIAHSHAGEQGLTDTPQLWSGDIGRSVPHPNSVGSLRARMPTSSKSQQGPPSATPAGPGAAGSFDSSSSSEPLELLGLGYVGETAAEQRLREKEDRQNSEGWFSGRLAETESARTWSEHELDEHCRRLFDDCCIRPHESPGAMFFRCWGDNPFEYAELDRLSTFSVDVDTASYTLARRYLQDGYLPTKAQVRTEEFVNFFDADVPAPERGQTFALALELAPSLFGTDSETWMLRVALRGEDVDRVERAPLALTFVLDISGSMNGERIMLAKQAIALCVRELSTTDSIGLVTFNTQARIVSPMVSAASRGAFENALVGLTPAGSTNAAAGLELGYELAAAALTPGAVNRVILLSDGVANTGETDQARILARVAEYRAKGIYLNSVGVGMENHNDVFLEQLADKGDGLCHYVDRLDEARKVFVEEFAQTLQPIARDVKVQVEFDPAQIERYRLLGYENRAVADADFRNDAVDAGEVNAGHQVVALYELVRRPGADSEAPLAVARLRWKPPFAVDRGAADAEARQAAEHAQEKAVELRAPQALASWDAASFGYRRDVLVAQFAELLRRSVHARGDSWDELLARLQRLVSERTDSDLAELQGLVLRARELARHGMLEDDELRRWLDELCRSHYDEGCRRELEREQATDDELSRQAEELRRRIEDRIREILRERHVAPADRR